jgi:hypothetical protein
MLTLTAFLALCAAGKRDMQVLGVPDYPTYCAGYIDGMASIRSSKGDGPCLETTPNHQRVLALLINDAPVHGNGSAAIAVYSALTALYPCSNSK